jgi:hypothetical protein
VGRGVKNHGNLFEIFSQQERISYYKSKVKNNEKAFVWDDIFLIKNATYENNG